MSRGSFVAGLAAAAAIGALAGIFAVQAASEHDHGAHEGEFAPPPALRADHERLHEELGVALDAGGETAKAAEQVKQHLSAHFQEENEVAMPPLGLLQPLAQGNADEAAMRHALKLAQETERKLPKFLEEHEQIKAAVLELEAAAEAEGKTEVAQFARRLKTHAETEEQVLYPTTILIGKYLEEILPAQ